MTYAKSVGGKSFIIRFLVRECDNERPVSESPANLCNASAGS